MEFSMESKICKQCGIEKSIDEFSRLKPVKSFKYTHQPHHTYCKRCNADRAKQWRKDKPKYNGSGKVKNIPKEDRLLMSAIRQRLVDARGRCKKFNKPEPLVTDMYLYELYKNQERKCALSGVPLDLIKESPYCLSLDQIDPGKGYEEGNVQWLTWAVNRAKGEMSTPMFLSMCEIILENQKVQRLSQ